jgi:nucleoside-diphosphate-sugar epimerase
MRVLFIGGTGNISGACSRLAVSRGIDLYLLNRGQRPTIPGAHSIVADLAGDLESALGDLTFDAVVDFVAFDVPDVERDLRVFAKRCGQYVFISSAACYRKPCLHPLTEAVPIENPVSPYARRKIACEQRLAHARLPVTIVRPSLTYDSFIPLPLASGTQWTLVDRMLRGRPIVVHGDGCVPWTVTHSDDFAVGLVGLLGNPAAMDQAFHITGDEVLSWDEIHRLVGAAAGVRLEIVHMASEDIAALIPEKAASLLGDKSHAMIFDNTKIKTAVPDFRQRILFADGITRTLQWFRADPRRMVISAEADAEIERLLAAKAAISRWRENI